MSKIYYRSGREAWPNFTLEPTVEGNQTIQHTDCVAVSFEQFAKPLGTPGNKTVDRGYGLYVDHEDKGEIKTLHWSEKQYTPAYYARLAREIEQRVGRENLIILVS